MDTPTTAIDTVIDQLRQVRMPHARAIAADTLTTATAQRWHPTETLRALLTAEIEGRERSAASNRRKAAKLPTGKTFATWDETLSTIPLATQRHLRTLEFLTNAENVVIAGPSGTGKSFFLEALAHDATERGYTVAWFDLETLGQRINAHRIDHTIHKAITKIMRADLICIDDVGLLPVSKDDAEAFYRVVAAAYEKRSIAVSSNIHPSGFDSFMPKTLATATVDRLLHHAHLTQTSGESIRYQQALGNQTT